MTVILNIAKININSRDVNIKDSIALYISIISIGVTGYFSYSVLKSSRKSYELSESIKDSNIKKDEEKVKQAARRIYYDLIIGFGNIRKVYFDKILLSMNKINLDIADIAEQIHILIMSPENLYFDEAWRESINQISVHKDLNEKDISMLYEIYNYLFSIKDLNDVDNYKMIQEVTEQFFKFVFADNFIKFIDDFNTAKGNLLSLKNKKILLDSLTLGNKSDTMIDKLNKLSEGIGREEEIELVNNEFSNCMEEYKNTYLEGLKVQIKKDIIKDNLIKDEWMNIIKKLKDISGA